jgi:putative peptidoglycan lipid II flippase
MNLVVDLIFSVALYKPLGIAGLVIGTAVANAVMTALQIQYLTIGFDGRLEGAQTLMITMRIVLASGIMAVVAWVVWKGVSAVAGTSLIGQILSVGLAVGLALYVYTRLVLAMRIPEARQIERLVMGRLRTPRPPARG